MPQSFCSLSSKELTFLMKRPQLNVTNPNIIHHINSITLKLGSNQVNDFHKYLQITLKQNDKIKKVPVNFLSSSRSKFPTSSVSMPFECACIKIKEQNNFQIADHMT